MAASFRAKLTAGCCLTGLAALAPSIALRCVSAGGVSLALEAAGLAAGLAFAGVVAFAVARALAKPIGGLGRDLHDLTAEAAALDAVATAQRNLDTNIEFLRSLLYGRGDPVQIGDKLYFGDLLVNGNNEIVDKVQNAHGGRATVCLGDLRLCTNVTDAGGKRMTGTKLAPGPAYDAVFKQGMSFRGEADLFGERFIVIYEPILFGGDVIGLIFVAVSKATVSKATVSKATVSKATVSKAAGTGERPAGGAAAAGALAQMGQDLDALRELTVGKERVMRESLEQRYVLADGRRKTEALGRAAALAQLNVVTALSAALEKLADADLTHQIETEFPQEYQKLKSDFGAAIQSLGETMRAIMGEAQSMRGHSSEIATAVDELSRRTEQQAASLEQTAASLDIITATVKRTAEGVNDARRVVTGTRTDAGHSNQIVTQAIAAMGAIEDSSAKISQIITVIDDIALQTNLLALNAGVEAARAGDAGRGFAVVASEVRALAQRSAEAAKEIKDLIQASTRQVTQGVALVGETGRCLDRIVEQVAEVDGIVATISETAREQAVSLQEVNTAITHMDRATQQNAAMVEESTAASHHLAEEALKLQELVGQFRTGNPAPVRQAPGLSGRTAAMTEPARARAATPPAFPPRRAKAAPAGDWDAF